MLTRLVEEKIEVIAKFEAILLYQIIRNTEVKDWMEFTGNTERLLVSIPVPKKIKKLLKLIGSGNGKIQLDFETYFFSNLISLGIGHVASNPNYFKTLVVEPILRSKNPEVRRLEKEVLGLLEEITKKFKEDFGEDNG